MDIKEIKELLKTKEYDFLRTDPHLGNRILFLCLGGSYSYGTNIETSDIDIRGVTLDTTECILGLEHFEQRQDSTTDTCIYSLSKFIELVSNCNPNIIEMLFCKPEHYIYISPLGQILLDNKHLFLTKKAFYTFGGYAHAQLNRLENALARDGNVLTEEEIQKHISRSMKNCLQNCIEKFDFEEDQFKIYVDKYDKNYNKQQDKLGTFGIFMDAKFEKLPVAEFDSLLLELSQVVRDFNSSVGQRNKKKDDLHLNKHMMHLIRLYLMCNEILSENDLHTYRENDLELLMNIRNGKYRDENGRVIPEFYEMLQKLEAEAKDNFEKTSLPKCVNKYDVYEKIIKPIYSQTMFKEEN